MSQLFIISESADSTKYYTIIIKSAELYILLIFLLSFEMEHPVCTITFLWGLCPEEKVANPSSVYITE